MNEVSLLISIQQLQEFFWAKTHSRDQLLAYILELSIHLTGSKLGLIVGKDNHTETPLSILREYGLQGDSVSLGQLKILIQTQLGEWNNNLPQHSNLDKDNQVHSMIAIPISYTDNPEIIIVLANCLNGYAEELEYSLRPFILTCSALLQINSQLPKLAYTSEDKFDSKEEELSAIEEELRQSNQHLMLLNTKVTESERKYKYIFENNPLPMWIYDEQTLQILDVNHTAILKYGYSRDEFMKISILDLRSKDEEERLINYLKTKLPTYNNARIWEHIKKNGETIHVEVFGHAFDNEGLNSRLVLVNDVTESIKAENQLLESEANLKAIFDSSMSFEFLLDKKFDVIKVNQSGLNYLKLNFKESNPINKSILNFIDSEKVEKVKEILSRCILGETVFDEEHITLPTGNKMWIEAVFTPVKDTKNKILGILMSIHNITVMKEAFRELERMNEVFQSLLDNLPVMVAMFDVKGKFIFCNQTLINLLGYSLDEVKKKDIVGLLYPDLLEKQKVLDFINSGVSGWQDFKTTTKSGKVLNTSWANVKLLNGSSITIGQDITLRKTIEEKLFDQNQQLREYAFLTSHHLRRPLANILGLVSLFNLERISDASDREILLNLLISSNELDAVIHQINDVLKE